LRKKSLNHHIIKGIIIIIIHPPPFRNHPIQHHQKNNFLKFLKNPIFLHWETTKLLPPMPPKKQTFGLVTIRKKITFLNPLRKTSFWKGVELPHLPLLTQKKPFWKRKRKLLTPCPLFLKLHLQLVILLIYLNNPLFIPIGTP
jgi:hypothetical protein